MSSSPPPVPKKGGSGANDKLISQIKIAFKEALRVPLHGDWVDVNVKDTEEEPKKRIATVKLTLPKDEWEQNGIDEAFFARAKVDRNGSLTGGFGNNDWEALFTLYERFAIHKKLHHVPHEVVIP